MLSALPRAASSGLAAQQRNRRDFVTASPSLALLLLSAAGGCRSSRAGAKRGGGPRLQFRPQSSIASAAHQSPLTPGVHGLGLRSSRDAQLYVPSRKESGPWPLAVYLHGAGGSEQQGVRRMGAFADQFGFLLLSPASRDRTWDAIRGSYGEDVRAIDEALQKTASLCPLLDPKRIAVCGFSDGASYALGLGVSNGELFGSVLAFSPGFVPPGFQPSGGSKPAIFVSHGAGDEILPIDSCSRQIVPALRKAGYGVTFQEFDGPHTVPKAIAEQAFAWWLAK